MKFTLSKISFILDFQKLVFSLFTEPLFYFGLIFLVVPYKVSQGVFTGPMFKFATSLAEVMTPATCLLSLASGLLFLLNALRKALSKSVIITLEEKK